MAMVDRIKVVEVPKRPKGFQKGNTHSVGNNGRTVALATQYQKRFIAAAIEHALMKEVKANNNNKNPVKNPSRRIDRLVEAAIRKAEKGDIFAFNSLADRVEGKPVNAHEHTGADGAPIASVNVHMTLGEAVRRYQQMLENIEDDGK